MNNINKAKELFEAMIQEKIVYIKGSFVKETYPDNTVDDEAFYPVKVESIWCNDTVNLTYSEGDSFIDTIEGVEFDDVFILKLEV